MWPEFKFKTFKNELTVPKEHSEVIVLTSCQKSIYYTVLLRFPTPIDQTEFTTVPCGTGEHRFIITKYVEEAAPAVNNTHITADRRQTDKSLQE